MKNIDLTSPESALNYLRGLDPSTALSLPGPLESNTEGDAVRAITGCENANKWADGHKRWDWTAGELVAQLEAEMVTEYEIRSHKFIPATDSTRIVYCPVGATASESKEHTIHHSAGATEQERADEIDAWLESLNA